MKENPSKNLIIIKYCLPLSVVSFIIFLCGFFLENVYKTSLWASAIFTILVSLIIYCYTTEKITRQNQNEIERLELESKLLSKIHYGLHLINPKMKLKEKVYFSLKLLSENISNTTFVCFLCDNNDFDYLTGLKYSFTKQIEKITSDDPLIGELSNKIKTLTDIDYLKKTGGLSKPINIFNKTNLQGQILSIDFYSNVLGILVVIKDKDLSDLDNFILSEFCKSLALILEDHKNYVNNEIKEKPEKNKKNNEIESLYDNLYEHMFANIISTLPGWDLVSYFVPSSKRADFMDILNLNTDKQMIFLGKCSSSGLNSAIYVDKLKLIIRCFIEEFQSPAKLLNKISRYLNSELMPDIFVDLTAMTFSSSDNQITLAIAGNTIPIINRTRSGYAEIPELETGIPLGLFNQGTEPYKDQYINVMPGDGILLHTDGITDFPGKGLERLSNEDLKNILDKIPEQKANEMLNSFIRQIKNQNNNELPEEDHSIIYLKAE